MQFMAPPRRWAGIPAGTIVGITGPMISSWRPSRTFPPTSTRRPSPFAAGRELVQLVQTKESGRVLDGARRRRGLRQQPGQHDRVVRSHSAAEDFSSYTSVAANPSETAFSTSPCARGWWASWPRRAERRSWLVYVRAEADSDFLTLVNQFPLRAPTATGALLLPALSK